MSERVGLFLVIFIISSQKRILNNMALNQVISRREFVGIMYDLVSKPCIPDDCAAENRDLSVGSMLLHTFFIASLGWEDNPEVYRGDKFDKLEFL